MQATEKIGWRDEGWVDGWVGIYDVVMEALTVDKILGEGSSSFRWWITGGGSAVNVCASELLRTIQLTMRLDSEW